MANIDQPEPVSSESSQDAPQTVTVTAPVVAGEPLHTLGHSPAPNREQPYAHPCLDHVLALPSAPPVSSPFAIPHPKRFNAVNINKKFLQKNSSSSATASIAASLATAAKAGSPAPRSAPQPSTSHSRLVTAKLTSTAQLSTTTGPGWSRPSSATPPVSATPSTSSNVPPPQPPAPTTAVPQFPHAGKVIQPQPRNALPSSSPLVKKDIPTKPAWGNPKTLPITSDSAARSDFPTAAEVAQGRIVKLEEPKSEDSPLQKHIPSQEADAFRGVHLDPNAHHWDEMEEDDDNFLDNVIEFGDGRQYKVAPTIQPTTPVGEEALISSVENMSTEHVSKEERFADDFDRSWPPTRQSPLVFQRDLPSRSSHHISISPAPSQPNHSSAEGSRVLFNERSNRLEPYASPHFPNRLGSSFGFSRRNAHGEPALSPVEPRLGRDIPPHSPVHPVHLLQKHSEGTHDVSVQSSRNHLSDFLGRKNVERDSGQHNHGGDQGQNKVRGRDPGWPSGSFLDSRTIGEKRSRRLSSASFASSIPDGQQGSSHSSDVPFSRRSQPRESPLQHLSVLPANISSQASRLSQLPGTSHAANTDVQPSAASSMLDIEGVHKTAMHISAERAKQRRKLEEEEREKEKERARKKATELEARMMEAGMAAATEITHKSANSTQGSNQLASDLEEHKSSEAAQVNVIERRPSLKPVSRTQRDVKTSRLNTSSTNEPPPPSEQVDSWRTRTRPPAQQTPILSPLMFHEPSDVIADDNLEVVDYSDLGKFVGGERSSLTSETPEPSSYSPASPDRRSFRTRPVASDFFDDDPPHGSVAKSPSLERHTLSIVPEASPLPSSEPIQVLAPSIPSGTKEFESHRHSGPNGAHSFVRSHPSPTTPHHRLSKGPAPFRQVTMSALDDVMSRIKGALDDMQVDAGRGTSSNEPIDLRHGVPKPKVRVVEPPFSTRTLSRDAKWLPPALRQPPQDLQQVVFGPTGCEPPCSPPPVTVVVKLPKLIRPIDVLPKRQLHLLKKNSFSLVRFDTLSWDPPVDGMSRRDFSLNEILFKRPPPAKGNKLRYKVQIPRATRTYSASLPKVNLPSGLPKPNSAPGRSKALDDLPTWRRGPVSSSTTQKTTPSEECPPTLDVISCSPPPELRTLPSESTVTEEVPVKSESYLVRHRTLPKLPPGSAIGFYRDPGRDSRGAVNFTVTSELEEGVQVSQLESSMLLSSSIANIPSPATVPPDSKGSTAIASPNVDGIGLNIQPPSLSLITQADGKVSDEPTERSLRTPASATFSTPWTKSPLSFASKDSPARAPDPEHLRAVWSQTADKEQVSAINSLEGIADDLTALPFTIQEVKSEDGETPPPTSATVASKISLHDVTRAFQQVPTPSNVSSHRPPPLSPPVVNGPITRPQTFSYPTPHQAPGAAMRPHFPPFSSPMLAHSPSPTVIYPPTAPSPIPRHPMNGPPPLYNQPMWVPVQPSQNNSAVRPLPSPYPAQMVAYPAPTPVHPVYASSLSPQNVPPSVTGSAPPRPRGVPVLSPVMHHAAPANVPMYNGSPVLMHPSAMIPPGHRPPYMNSGPPERGQGRSENISAAPLMQQPPHSQGHVPPQPMYTHIPFSRPSW